MGTLFSLGQLVVVYLALSALVLEPRNPKQHSRRQIRQIARSIETFGFAVPILVDRTNKIVAGHGRYFAAQSLGLTEVPVIRLEHLTEAQAKAFRIADNRLTEISIWDDRLLAESLKELSELDLNFSLEATGFDTGEIDFRIEQLTRTRATTKPTHPHHQERQKLSPNGATSGCSTDTEFAVAMRLNSLLSTT